MNLSIVTPVFNQAGYVDTCYVDLEYVDRENTDRVVRPWVSGPYDPKKWYQGWMAPHPTFFMRREVYEKCDLEKCW